jgi:hypothetical protein
MSIGFFVPFVFQTRVLRNGGKKKSENSFPPIVENLVGKVENM